MNALKTALFALLCTAPLALPVAGHAETPSAPAEAPAKGGTIYLEGTGWGTLAGAPSAPAGEPALTESLTSGATLGWQPMESLRMELEYLYRSSAGARIGTIAQSEPLLDSRSLMANALIDFKFTDWVTPYVGVGVGWARVEPPVSGFSETGRDDVFAYQGIVGLSVPFTDTLSFFADGRYMRTDEFTPGFDTVGPTDHLQSWSATAGIRFTFGGGGK